MTLKGWMLGKSEAEARSARMRTPTALDAGAREPAFSVFGRRVVQAAEAVHLGPYAPLIGAIREELEEFVTNQLRLHLAIAERDRYVLASIEVECEGGESEHELLRRFVHEFRPEQIKDYLAREIIAGLRNASAIDLSQFGGLNAERDDTAASRDEERYGDLIAELANGAPRGAARAYRVTLVGRWSEIAAAAKDERPAAREGPRTPLAARPVGVDVEDGSGMRRVELAVVPGHRYSVGKGEGCDIVVDGAYASRRHCELWFEKGAWWVTDAGSTNGIRVDALEGGATRDPADTHRATRAASIELRPGAWVVLAAHTSGEPAQIPRFSIRADAPPAPLPIATGARPATPATPVTPIAAPRNRVGGWAITLRMASGVRSVDVHPDALPFRVGRSRTQALVIDWAHADVSGRHLEVVALDPTGARIVVHGDNGVTLQGVPHGPGAELLWKPGETLLLGTAGGVAPCELTLARQA